MNTKFLMDDYCFACGVKNDNGLKLNIVDAHDGVEAKIKLPLWTQGYKKIAHGGIISTILDELAVWAAFKKGHKVVTASLNIRIKKAMTVSEEYTARGTVVNIKHGLVQAKSEIVNKDNEIIAFADVKLLKSDSIK